MSNNAMISELGHRKIQKSCLLIRQKVSTHLLKYESANIMTSFKVGDRNERLKIESQYVLLFRCLL
ncbi:1493_t:CDS:2 [Ambispora gerdemannii]|uniref:1493_t:CDS:1 n=1 Tax=Ambispora gerdemannii TaxID=144530 RepID=A0A9N8V2Y7_9GLOM|nr:1493_t:CDS:2 [Ambispora gerdemannii]